MQNNNTNQKGTMTRIRLNQEYRNKIANRMRVHLEQEDTHEKQTYDNLKADQIDINDNAWKMAEKIVRRHYTEEDVEKAYYLQNKFENVSTIAKDSCFHFHYLGKKETRDYDNNVLIEDNVPIEKHFDFRLNGSIDTESNSSYSNNDNDYGYALFRDELKAQDDCNPDILIEQEGKDNNPHKTKYVDNNNKYLGNDDKGYGKEWNDKYQLDLIGRDYCRDRSIACTEEEFNFLITWKQAKGQFVMAHQKWIKSILDQMKEIKIGLKGYKYLDEALELCTELGLNITDAEIIRTNSTGLTIYNPKNLADRIKGMKNKREKTRAEKIAERILYEKQQQSVN
jgi:formate hydrogenlyase subunit 6/NADH:ubiquinone oxidoreductase subunit I